MVELALGVVLVALALLVLSNVTPFLQIKDFGSLVLAALLLGLVPGILGLLFQWADYQPAGVTIALGLQLLDKALLLGLVSMFVGGVEFQGFFGFIATSLVLMAVDLALPIIVSYATTPV